MAAGGYVHYDLGTGAFRLPPAHVPILALDGTPASVGGILQWLLGVAPALDAVSAALRTGKGVAPDAYGPDLLAAMERIGAGMYTTALVDQWLPLLPRMHAQLAAGAQVADIGCGSGRALITLRKDVPAQPLHRLRRLRTPAGAGPRERRGRGRGRAGVVRAQCGRRARSRPAKPGRYAG